MRLQDNVRAFLKEPRFGVLATINGDGTPQQTVVWYDLSGDDILMNTRANRVKDGNLRRDGRASLCVSNGYSYVTLEGVVELNDDQPTAQDDIRRLAIRYDGEESGERQAAEKFSKQRRVTILLKVTKVIAYELE